MIVIGVIAVILLALPMREYLRQHSEISAAEAQRSEQQQRVDDLQRRVDQWSNDDYVRGQARERLHFLLPGEVGYVVIGPNGGTDELSEQAPKAEEPKGPWYGKLWNSVRAADRNE